MGTMGFLDMDVETSGLTLRIKLCKNMHKWVHENQGYSYIDQGHVKCIQFCLRLCRGPTFSKPKGAWWDIVMYHIHARYKHLHRELPFELKGIFEIPSLRGKCMVTNLDNLLTCPSYVLSHFWYQVTWQGTWLCQKQQLQIIHNQHTFEGSEQFKLMCQVYIWKKRTIRCGSIQ